MKISIVTLKHYRRPRPGSKKGQPRGRIPSWEGFGKACKEAWEAIFGLNDAPSLLKTGSNSPFCPPFPPDRKARPFKSLVEISNELHAMENRRTAEARHARVEELNAQVQALQEHNTKEVERRRTLEKELSSAKGEAVAQWDRANRLEGELSSAKRDYAECLASLKDSESAWHKKNAEVKDAKHLLAEEMQANKDLTAQLAKANALSDSLNSQAVNLAGQLKEERRLSNDLRHSLSDALNGKTRAEKLVESMKVDMVNRDTVDRRNLKVQTFLRSIEWSGLTRSKPCCPACKGMGKVHKVNCPMAAMLRISISNA